jgi:ribosome-associated heat shock protein Hsp15
MTIRWDKYIWAVRLCKTRSQASEALSKGRITVNGKTTKPSRNPQVGDRIQVYRNNAVLSFQVLALLDKRVGAKLVAEFLKDITPLEELDKLAAYRLAQQSYRHFGTGKPTKKDRRNIQEFLDDWQDDESN